MLPQNIMQSLNKETPQNPILPCENPARTLKIIIGSLVSKILAFYLIPCVLINAKINSIDYLFSALLIYSGFNLVINNVFPYNNENNVFYIQNMKYRCLK